MTTSPGAAAVQPSAGGEGREWPRVLALFLLLRLIAPLGVTTLVGIPFLLLLLVMPVQRREVLLLGALLAVVVLAGPSREGLWYVERGWALLAGGSFAALTMLRPTLRVTHRALGAVAGASALTAAAFVLRPQAWSVVDWTMRERVITAVGQALSLVRSLDDGSVVTPEMEQSIFQTAEVQAHLFPALVALATVASLALAWWGYTRLALGRKGALGSIRDFRFEDQLVWIFIAGLLLVAISASDGWTRAGSNTLLFMGALYALRGVAVLLFLNGGLSLLGGVLLVLAMLYVAPIVAMAALIVGLGDTWLDVRTRVRSLLS